MLASFSFVPVGGGEELKDDVARVIDLIDRSGISYSLGAMQTTVEGEMEEVMDLIMKCHRLMKSRASRVLTKITIDDRTGSRDRLWGKIHDVEAVLGRKVSHE